MNENLTVKGADNIKKIIIHNYIADFKNINRTNIFKLLHCMPNYTYIILVICVNTGNLQLNGLSDHILSIGVQTGKYLIWFNHFQFKLFLDELQ